MDNEFTALIALHHLLTLQVFIHRFADLVGFTAWSSVREPAQVFILLETIYHAFDEIAKRRKVFKVETVGDCYVGKDLRPLLVVGTWFYFLCFLRSGFNSFSLLFLYSRCRYAKS